MTVSYTWLLFVSTVSVICPLFQLVSVGYRQFSTNSTAVGWQQILLWAWRKYVWLFLRNPRWLDDRVRLRLAQVTQLLPQMPWLAIIIITIITIIIIIASYQLVRFPNTLATCYLSVGEPDYISICHSPLSHPSFLFKSIFSQSEFYTCWMTLRTQCANTMSGPSVAILWCIF